MPEYEIKADTDGRYKIFKRYGTGEHSFVMPVGKFYDVCDGEAREVQKLIDKAQG